VKKLGLLAMILELKKFDNFPAHTELSSETVRIDIGMDSILSIDKSMLSLDIQKSGDEYFCQGKLKAVVKLECARCLESFEQELSGNPDFIASPPKTDDTPTDDEDRVYYDSNLVADLWEIVRQSVILAVSLKPLCSEDCRGLCPQCGTNRNEKDCNCKTKTVDPRLEPLKNLL
jgi:uncharacterized protein